MLEAKRTQLSVLIHAAQAAIDSRLQQIAANPQDSVDEQQAIAGAQAGLRVLEKELPKH